MSVGTGTVFGASECIMSSVTPRTISSGSGQITIDVPPVELNEPPVKGVQEGLTSVRVCQDVIGKAASVMAVKITGRRDPVEAITLDFLEDMHATLVPASVGGIRQCKRYCFVGLMGFCPLAQRDLSPEEICQILGGRDSRRFSEPTGSFESTVAIRDIQEVLGRAGIKGGNPLSNMSRTTRDRIITHLNKVCSDLGLFPPEQLSFSF